MTKRAVLYARVSGDDRKYATSGIDSQLADCRKYASERGYEIVGEVYETPDKATSGADWLPELDRVMKLAQGGGFDVLVVREIDRLARNRFKQMSVEIQLESCGARVEYVIGQFEESAEGRLLKGLMSEFAEYEREKIKERTVRGTVRSVKAGNVKVGASAPYGYDLATVDGRRALKINEEEAAVIRLIFDWYVVQDFSLMKIRDQLDALHIPKPARGTSPEGRGSSKWSSGTLNGILDNETYIGHWHYRKTRKVKDIQTGKIKYVPRPREEWLRISVPPIIDERTFTAAGRRRKTNKRLKGKQNKNFYMLGGMVKCGHCGRFGTGATKQNGHQYYKCSVTHAPRRHDFTCDNNQGFRMEEVDRAVWGWVKGIFMSPETLQEALNTHLTRQAEVHAPALQMIDSTAARLEETEQEKARLLKAYTAGVLSLDDIAVAKIELDKRAADLTQALAGLRSELSPTTITPDTVNRIQQDAADMRRGVLGAESDPQTKRRILERLQFEGRLISEDGAQYVDVECILGFARLSTEFTTTDSCAAAASRWPTPPAAPARPRAGDSHRPGVVRSGRCRVGR